MMEGQKAGRGEARRLMLPVGWRKGRLGAEWSQGVCPAQKGTEGSQGFAVTPKLDERKWKLRETWPEVARRVQIPGAEAQSARHAGRESGPSVWLGGLGVSERGGGGSEATRL